MFKVIKVVSSYAYKLDILDGTRLVFYIIYLCLVSKDLFLS